MSLIVPALHTHKHTSTPSNVNRNKLRSHPAGPRASTAQAAASLRPAKFGAIYIHPSGENPNSYVYIHIYYICVECILRKACACVHLPCRILRAFIDQRGDSGRPLVKCPHGLPRGGKFKTKSSRVGCPWEMGTKR